MANEFGTINNAAKIAVANLADGTDGQLITWDAAGVAAVVPTGTATHVLTSNGAGAAPTFQAAPSGGAMVLISDVTVGVGGAATIDFSSIPATYLNLMLAISVRTDKAGVGYSGVLMKLNNDSTAGNYSYHMQYHYATNNHVVTSGFGAISQTFYANAATSPANWFATYLIHINHYANTNIYKQIQVRGQQQNADAATGDFYMYDGFVVWKSAVAVNRFTLSLSDGSSFVANCRASLYGY